MGSDAAKLTVNGGQAPCCSARHGSARGSDHYCKGTLNHAGIGAPEICRRRIVHLVQVATGVVQKRAKKLIGGLLASRNCEAARLDPWS